jgi:hypothetical protein
MNIVLLQRLGFIRKLFGNGTVKKMRYIKFTQYDLKKLYSVAYDFNEDISRRESFSEARSNNYFDFIHDRPSTIYLDKQQMTPSGFSKQHNEFFKTSPLVSNFNTKTNEEDAQFLHSLDVIKLVNKFAGSFFTNMLFNTIDLPNTRNLKTINKETPRNSKKFNSMIIDNDEEGKLLRKKNIKSFIVIVFVIIILIIIFIIYSFNKNIYLNFLASSGRQRVVAQGLFH